jgi:hypothetical protein
MRNESLPHNISRNPGESAGREGRDMAGHSARRDVDPEILFGRAAETPFNLVFEAPPMAGRSRRPMTEMAARPKPASDVREGATPGTRKGWP